MKRTMICGWLVVAAALVMSVAACTGPDPAQEIPLTDEMAAVETPSDTPSVPAAQPTGTTVHVSVSAGIGSDAATRADVDDTMDDYNGTPIRKLLFTEGDRLFVTERLDNTKRLAGYLDMVPNSINEYGTGATFEGDLKVYNEDDGTETTYDFSGISDPLTVDASCFAYLIPKDAREGFVTIYNNCNLDFNYEKSIARDVNTLMKSAIKVYGQYVATSQGFSLSGDSAILNCKISGFVPGSTLSVKMIWALDLSHGDFDDEISYDTDGLSLLVDNAGFASFAIGLPKDNNYYVLQVSDNSIMSEYELGQKDLKAKVYNVTRNAIPDDKALITFKPVFSLSDQAGSYASTALQDAQTTSFIIKHGNQETTISAPVGTYFTDGCTVTALINFDTYNIDKPLTISSSAVSYHYNIITYTNKTFIGTVSGLSIRGGQSYDVGEVILVKQ